MSLRTIRAQIDSMVADSRVIQWRGIGEELRWLNDSTYVINPSGTLHLFRGIAGNDSSLEKLSTSVYHGNTFGRLFFVRENTPYMFGGQGLFTNMTKLLKFDFKSGQWYVVDIDGFQSDYSRIAVSWLGEDCINVLLVNDESSDKLVYGVVDLNTYEFSEKGVFTSNLGDLKLNTEALIFDSKSFQIFQYPNSKGCNFYILNKLTGDYFEPSFYHEVQCQSDYNNVFMVDSVLYKPTLNGEMDSIHLSEATLINKINLTEYYQNKIRQDQGFSMNRMLWPVASVVFASFSLLLLRLLKRKNTSVEIENSESITDSVAQHINEGLSIYELKLEPHRGRAISRDEIDALLEIGSENQDLTKANRSRLIQSINANGSVQIKRERDPNDKRVYRYYIK